MGDAEMTEDPMSREAMLAKTMVELADTLVADFDVVDLLTLLTDRCVEVFDVGAAGLVLAAPQEGLQVVAASSEATRVLGLFELQSDEGPCVDCYRSGQPVANHDLTTANNRWPRFAAEALAAGFRSVHALPLRLRGFVIGALNLLHIEPGNLQRADVDAAQALADVATIAIIQHRSALDAQVVTAQLNHALNSRVVIEQAKGILAERKSLDMDQAFARLRRHARSHNLRLADVARELISGSLSAAAFDRPQPTTPPPWPKPIDRP
jgi:GAF domain-containing protein